MNILKNHFAIFACFAALLFAHAANASRVMENLSRGIVAARTNKGAFVSWRLLDADPTNIGFNIYRSVPDTSPVKLNSTFLTAGTCFSDTVLTKDEFIGVASSTSETYQWIYGDFTGNHQADMYDFAVFSDICIRRDLSPLGEFDLDNNNFVGLAELIEFIGN